MTRIVEVIGCFTLVLLAGLILIGPVGWFLLGLVLPILLPAGIVIFILSAILTNIHIKIQDHFDRM